MFKFNNGRGAIICDRCSVIIQEDVEYVFIDNLYTEHVCYSCRTKEHDIKKKNYVGKLEMKSYKETKQQVWESFDEHYPRSLLKLLFTNPLTIFAVVDIAWNGWRSSDD